MAWPYRFGDLTSEQKAARRISLDFWALIAHYSLLVPVLVVFSLRLISWAFARQKGTRYSALPPSNGRTSVSQGRLLRSSQRWRSVVWWLGEPVCFMGDVWGHRDEWIFGSLAMVYFLVLCVAGTGNDYFHITKRFGAIATALLPMQYLLSLKAFNPISYLCRTSHEELNRYHRVLGRIVFLIGLLHVCFYLNYFFIQGIVVHKLTTANISVGVFAGISMLALTVTAIAFVRRLSYRVFFITHLAVAFALVPLLSFHSEQESAQTSMFFCFIFFLVDLGVRKFTAVSAPCRIECIPGTDLIKITAKMPAKKLAAFGERPGAHTYISVPISSRSTSNPLSPSFFLFEFLYNPFTVVGIDEESKSIVLVARVNSGPMTTHLRQLATSPKSSSGGTFTLNIEGPYGAASKRFSEFLDPEIHRTLLIAGGVGATFILPTYRALAHQVDEKNLEFIWAVRTPKEASWAVAGTSPSDVAAKEKFQIYLTRDASPVSERSATSSDMSINDGEVEMRPLRREVSASSASSSTMHSLGRPDLKRHIDDFFARDPVDRVAILACGPEEMMRDVRRFITPWVSRGRDVTWHGESFGW